MTLCDTGPLVALIDEDDRDHARCAALLPTLRLPLLTTWPCIAEAMHLLYRIGGYPAQEELWGYFSDGTLQLYPLTDADRERMRALMAQYRDTPMDLSDASLIAAAETLSLGRVFTLDSDFYVYRLADGSALEVAP